MRIASITIMNFRKLKNVRIEINDATTLFVGANNSGKTSAMDAMRKFLIRNDDFIFNDLTVINRSLINKIGETWEQGEPQKPSDLADWVNIAPTMDVWLDVDNNEFHYVAHIIPSLDWAGGKLGVRLCYLPKDIGKLFDDYRMAYNQARSTESSGTDESIQVKLSPSNLCDFIEKVFAKYFEVKAFILDPAKIDDVQSTDFAYECEDKNPLSKLIKIDTIGAQRGFADADSSNDVVSLSHQFRAYYNKHLDIDKVTLPEDLKVLAVLEKATEGFNKTLKEKFADSLDELQMLGYPGIADPRISIESKIKESTALEHNSDVQYALSDEADSFRLPEKYNGLGYQNLISIVFKLISFRDDRLHKGKASVDVGSDRIAPLHLVLLEEPEAHLHIQVQQVLIKKAFGVLTKGLEPWLKTQLVVSTHSSHITKEVEFSQIRYFKRVVADNEVKIPTAEVINLTDTFGKDRQTEKFVQRYINVTHCDLFFADAIIFVEGTSENVLVPYFIKNDYGKLDSRYITILPVGGSHSHKFKPLVERLRVPTLIITDIDSANATGHRETTPPKRKADQITRNTSIRGWGIQDNSLDYLFDLKCSDKTLQDNTIYIAYQTPVEIIIGGNSIEALSATFEETLIYANTDEICTLDSDGIVKKVKDAVSKMTTENPHADNFCTEIYNAIHNSSSTKVSFALELMHELEQIKTPPYIAEGLGWLEKKLSPIYDANNIEA